MSGSKVKVNKIIILAVSLILVMLFNTANSGAAAGPEVISGVDIPLEKGNYWIYKGTVKYQKEGVEKPSQKMAALKMEISDIIVRDAITAAIVKGYPLDIAGFDGSSVPRGDYVIVRAGCGSYYLLSGEDSINALKKLKDGDDNLHELVDESDMIADFPMAVGKVFGEAEQVTRADGKYFWRVEECVDTDLSAVKGTPVSSAREYWLFYLTNPDRQKAGFVPGVGITSYSYRHNGTVMEFDVKLAECFINSAKPEKKPAAALPPDKEKKTSVKKIQLEKFK
jgi:hypothetical protein